MGSEKSISGSELAKDQKMHEELQAATRGFNHEMQQVFGTKMKFWNRTEPIGDRVSKNSLTSLIQSGLDAARAQQMILKKFNRITEATNMDLVFGSEDSLISITDFERALEFLSDGSARTNSEALIKVMDFLMNDAKSRPDEISPNQRPDKPSLLFPYGVGQSPIFGFGQQAQWNHERRVLDEATTVRIRETEDFVKKEMSGWISQNKKNLTTSPVVRM